MDIPVELFLGFIGTSIAIAIFGFIRQPQIPACLVIGGMFILTLAVSTDNIVFGNRIDNIIATPETLNITSSTTTIQVYSYNVVSGTQLLTVRADGSNFHTVGVHVVNSSSALVGDIIECINIPLLKSGSPTGTIDVGILGDSNAIVNSFGTQNVASLTTAFIFYEYCLPEGQSYEIQSGDRIGFRWVTFTTSDASNFVQTSRNSMDVFDSTRTVSTRYDTAWSDTTTADTNAQFYRYEEIPSNIQIAGIGGIYSYEQDDLQFTEMPKVLFSLMGSIIMLVGGLMVMKD